MNQINKTGSSVRFKHNLEFGKRVQRPENDEFTKIWGVGRLCSVGDSSMKDIINSLKEQIAVHILVIFNWANVYLLRYLLIISDIIRLYLYYQF